MHVSSKKDKSNPESDSGLRRLLDGFRAWLKHNTEAHANAKPNACCSAPPPGAGELPAKKEN